MKQLRVLVVGGGIGGLTAGAALANRGVSVDLVEIKPELAGHGVGLGLGSNALSALSRIDVDDECLRAGVSFNVLELHDDREQPLTRHVFNRAIKGYPAFCAIFRLRLHAILAKAATRAGVHVMVGESPQDLLDDGNGVRVTFESGQPPEVYDAVLGFDGIRSAVRRTLFGDNYEPRYTGYGVWRAQVPRPASLANQRKYLGSGGNPGIGLMPISQDTAYLSYVRPEPEGLWYEQDVFVDKVREGLSGYPGELAEVRDHVNDPAAIVFSPLEVVAVSEPWPRGRIAIAGDAAHAGVPHLTQGAAMAIEDAIVLADELTQTQPVERALATYAAERYARAMFVQRRALRILETEQSNARRLTTEADLERISVSFRRQLEEADVVLGEDIFGNRAHDARLED